MNTKTDTVQSSADALRYPWEQHPGPEQVVEVKPEEALPWSPPR